MRETISSHSGAIGFIYCAVIQRTVDRPDDYAPGYHLILDAGPTVGNILHLDIRYFLTPLWMSGSPSFHSTVCLIRSINHPRSWSSDRLN